MYEVIIIHYENIRKLCQYTNNIKSLHQHHDTALILRWIRCMFGETPNQ